MLGKATRFNSRTISCVTMLGTKKDDLVVQFATEGITNRIFVSRYQLYLPDREQLRRELAIAIETEERSIVRRRKGKVAKR